MDSILYLLVRGMVALIQALPLRLVARLGRTGGAMAYWLDFRHRRVAVRNIGMCFPERTQPEIRSLARENFRRIGENYVSAIKTSAMTERELRPHITADCPELTIAPGGQVRKTVVAIGHFGNFELYARLATFTSGYQSATTYRGLRQRSLDTLLKNLRERSNCRYFERRSEAQLLKRFMNQPNALLGLLSDQSAGVGGISLPFFNRECSTTVAPAIFALRYDCVLLTGFCYRVGLAMWRLETGQEIPTHEHGRPRPAADIMLEVNRAFEAAIRRDPANWFWVHDRWKVRLRKRQARARPINPALTSRDPESASNG